MQKNRTMRPVVSSIVAGVVVMSTLLASVASGQARGRPGRDEARAAIRDSQPPRRAMARPGRGGMPDARMGIAPGAPRARMGGPGMDRMQGMAAVPPRGGSPASALLRMRQGLGLSDDQVRRLEQIASSGNRAPDPAEMTRARTDLERAMQGDGNIDAARAALERMNRIRTEQTLASLRSRQEAFNVLTPEQRSRAENSLGAARRNAIAGARGTPRGMGRGNALGNAPRGMALRNREAVEQARRRAMVRRAPNPRMQLRGPDLRPGPGMRAVPRGNPRLDRMLPAPRGRMMLQHDTLRPGLARPGLVRPLPPGRR